MAEPIRLVVLLSGSGTTLQNLLDRISDGRLHARILHVVSNKSNVMGLSRAEQAGIPTSTMLRRESASTEAYRDRVFDLCRSVNADLVCLAGFLQFLPIPADFMYRVMNIHPSLLPAFGGKGMYGHHVHEAVLAYGAKVSGCTVHFADNEYDNGPIIRQEVVPVLDDDTPATLAARVFTRECEAYPEAIAQFAAGRLKVEGRRVRIANAGD